MSGPERASAPRRGERGFALLIVLWTLVLVALVISQLNAAGRTEAELASNLRDAARLQALADGMVYEAASRLLDPSDRHWAADRGDHSLRLGDVAADVRITNESGKVDPNSASSALLVALLRGVGVDARTASSIAAAIVVWRYPDAQTMTQDAAAAMYRAAGRDYAPPRAAFESLDELGLVAGMTPEILQRLRPYITIYHEGDPDLRFADPVVKAAVASAGGLPVSAPATGRPALIVTVDVTLTAAHGQRAVRHAVIRVGLNQDGSIVRILDWQ